MRHKNHNPLCNLESGYLFLKLRTDIGARTPNTELHLFKPDPL